MPTEQSSSIEDVSPRLETSDGSSATVAHRIVIQPAAGWSWPDLKELWAFRELLYFLIWRDVKVRYKQTILGAAWAILQPAMMMIVFTLFFGRVAGISTGGLPAPLFYLTGLLPWFFFSSAVIAASNSIVGAERLITKIYFPRLAVPIAAVGAAAVDFLVASSLLAVFCLVYGITPTMSSAIGVLAFLIIAGIAMGLGTLLAALNIAYRDFRYVIPFMIQIGMFATPTIYTQPTGNETGVVAWLLTLNPMTTLVSTFRIAVVGGEIPWLGLGIASVWCVVLLIIGGLYFRRVEDRFADIV